MQTSLPQREWSYKVGVRIVARTTDENKDVQITRSASIIVLLAGAWFFVSPWIYGATTAGNAWNSWIVGVTLMLLAADRIRHPLTTIGLSWANCLLGVWTFSSPWIYNYTLHRGPFVNSIVVGVIVFIASMMSATGTHRPPTTPKRTNLTVMTR